MRSNSSLSYIQASVCLRCEVDAIHCDAVHRRASNLTMHVLLAAAFIELALNDTADTVLLPDTDADK